MIWCGLRPRFGTTLMTVVAGAVLYLLAGALAPLLAADDALDPQRLRWGRLDYKATKFMMTARSSVAVERVPVREAGSILIEAPAHEVVPLDTEPAYSSTLTSSLLGRTSTRTLWFDPKTGAALQNTVLETGKRKRKKISRYTRTGVLARRINPIDSAESDLPPSDWTKISNTFYPYNVEGVPVVVDAEVLFYLLSVIDLDRLRAGYSIVVFADEELVRVELQAGPTERLKIDYVVESTGGEERRSGKVDATVVSVRGEGLTESAQNRLEILGMRGDIDIFLDPETGLPLGVTGKIPYAGRVTVRLQRVLLQEPP